jgi:hypothetical protein
MQRVPLGLSRAVVLRPVEKFLDWVAWKEVSPGSLREMPGRARGRQRIAGRSGASNRLPPRSYLARALAIFRALAFPLSPCEPGYKRL